MRMFLTIAMTACLIQGCAYVRKRSSSTVTPDDRICGTRTGRVGYSPQYATRLQVDGGRVLGVSNDPDAFPSSGNGIPVVRCYNNHYTP